MLFSNNAMFLMYLYYVFTYSFTFYYFVLLHSEKNNVEFTEKTICKINTESFNCEIKTKLEKEDFFKV